MQASRLLPYRSICVFTYVCVCAGVLHRLAVGAVSAADDGAQGQDGGVIRLGWLTHAQVTKSVSNPP